MDTRTEQTEPTPNRTIETRIPIDANTYYFKDQVVNPDEYIAPGGFNPHNMRPWLICNEFGPLAIVYAYHEQDALDEMVDSDRLDSCLLSPEDEKERTSPDGEEEFSRLGNAGEPFDLTYISIRELPNKQYAPIKTHFIAMSGDHGCIPDHCEVYPDYDSAVSDLVDMFGLGRTRKARLHSGKYLELVQGIGEDDFGAQYCQVTKCTCDNPASHSKNSIDLDDYLA
jgi:hypothetical protein